MAWQQVAGRGGRGKGGKGQSQSAHPEIDKLAKELRAALMPKPHHAGSGERPRKPEWQCQSCNVYNFMDRRQCRWCSKLSPAAQTAPTPPVAGQTNRQRLPPGSVWSSMPAAGKQLAGAEGRPGAKVAALEKAIATARAAGAPEDALDSMGRQMAVLKSEAANSRPLGARLDSAEAKLAKADSKVQLAEAQLKKAMQQLEEARAQRRDAEQVLADLRVEVPQDNSGVHRELMHRTKALLERLESGKFAASADMPEELLAAMASVHEVVNAVVPLQPPTLDRADTSGIHQAEGFSASQAQEDDAAMSEGDVIESLDRVDESDEDALLNIARRLKRVRRS